MVEICYKFSKSQVNKKKTGHLISILKEQLCDSDGEALEEQATAEDFISRKPAAFRDWPDLGVAAPQTSTCLIADLINVAINTKENSISTKPRQSYSQI